MFTRLRTALDCIGYMCSSSDVHTPRVCFTKYYAYLTFLVNEHPNSNHMLTYRVPKLKWHNDTGCCKNVIFNTESCICSVRFTGLHNGAQLVNCEKKLIRSDYFICAVWHSSRGNTSNASRSLFCNRVICFYC